MELAWSFIGVALTAVGFAGCSPTVVTPPPVDAARYRLTSEAQLPAVAAAIDRFWSGNAKAPEDKPYRIDGNFEGVGKVEIRYVAFVQPVSPSPAIVISSGRTEHFGKYKEVVYDFWSNGYSVYIHDHRGQGLSGRMHRDPQMGHVDAFNDYVRDLHTFVTMKTGDHPVKFLVAHSMGGGIATLYLQDPERAKLFKAVAMSSPMHAPNMSPMGPLGCPWIRLTESLCSDCYAPLFFGGEYEKPVPGKNIYTTSNERLDRWMVSEESIPARARLGSASRHWVAEACRASTAMLADVKSMKTPILVVRSTEDEAVAPSAQDEFCDTLKASGNGNQCYPVGAPVSYERAKHELFIERDESRNDALARILEFFEKMS